ncbi:acyl-CoA dehydrogenase family protein [Aquabacter sp. CN5-332]|uniref:acyl-CoA dehydrogenase family protein n=1 Tax=Aquabacter sp. CN5-332 TaxID=3156608 RepID=UPI0032B3ED0D
MTLAAGTLDPHLAGWLDANAADLDAMSIPASQVLPRLAAGEVLAAGVPETHGGTGGDVTDAVEAIAAVSERSMAAGFVFWGHRSYIEYLLQSPNAALREALLPDLLAGRVAGATGLSNAMKFLSGLEELQVAAQPQGDGFVLDGKLPWVTNLKPEGFHVAAAVSYGDARGAFIASLAHDDPGLVRSADLDLMGLRATNTAAVAISGVAIPPERVIATDAGAWLPLVRPAFLGLQCGMSIGLARRALAEARACVGAGRHTLAEPLADLAAALAHQERALREGLKSGVFQVKAPPLFQIRIALAEIVAQAVGLELQAAGGRAYLSGPGAGFARRWREAAFVPVITPSLVQLKTVLAAQRQSAA